jgi:hypothetical protein
MAESPDALIDIYLSDQWRIHGGPGKKPAREELRDRLIPVVIKAFGSVESSLDVLLKESPLSNGHQINTLIRAYALYFLRMQREAIEASDQPAGQRFADLQGQFHELDENEKNLIGTAEPQDNERIHATLRTSVCNLPNVRPAASTVLNPFQQDASARPLGDNPFPPGHAAHLVFEEANWEAEKEIAELKSKLLETSVTMPAKTPAELLNTTLTYRLTYIDVIADKAARIVVNEETARKYGEWLNDFVKFEFEETLAWARSKAEGCPEGLLPYFNPEGLQLAMMAKLEHYKSKAASRVLQTIRSSATSEPSVASGGTAQSTEGTIAVARGERQFRETGETWHVQFNHTSVSVKHRIGMTYIAHLLRSPDRSFGCVDLQAAEGGNFHRCPQLDETDRADLHPAGFDEDEILDGIARKQCRDRLDSIEKDLREVGLNHDPGRHERLTKERDAITNQLKAATGLNGRPRTFTNDAEKARKAVSGAINDALKAIGKHHPEVATHLNDRIERGASCRYIGDGIEWEI